MNSLDVVDITQVLIAHPTYDHNYEHDFYKCFYYILHLFEDHKRDYDFKIYDKDIHNTSLSILSPYPVMYMRFKGNDSTHPLLLHGHIDTVEPEWYRWDDDKPHPLSGNIVKDNLYGVGALDMKGGIAMMVTAIHNALEKGTLPTDVILCLSSDEEDNSVDPGALWIVDNHPELFEGVRSAIGEGGGFPIYYKGCKFYTCSVAEKYPAMVWITIKNEAKHTTALNASAELTDKLLTLLTYISDKNHNDVTDIQYDKNAMINAIYDSLKAKGLISKRSVPFEIETDMNYDPKFSICFRDTHALAVIEGLHDLSRLPSKVRVGLNCAILPSHNPEDYMKLLLGDLDKVLTYEIEYRKPFKKSICIDMLPLLKESMLKVEPDAEVIPYLLPSFTDADNYAKLGIQTYGFIPMNLSEKFDVWEYIHNIDEQVPVDALRFGTAVLTEVISNYKGE